MWIREFLEHGAGSVAHGMISAAKLGFVMGPIAISSGTLQFTAPEPEFFGEALVFEAPQAIEALSWDVWGEEPVMSAEEAPAEAGVSEEADGADSAPTFVVAALPPPATFSHSQAASPLLRASAAWAKAARIAPAAPREHGTPDRIARTEFAARVAGSLGGPAVGAPAAPVTAPPESVAPIAAAPPPLIAATIPVEEPPPPAPAEEPEPAPPPAPPGEAVLPDSTPEAAIEVPETEEKSTACGEEAAYPSGAACGSLTFRAHSIDELEAYSKDFGFNGAVYAHLVVDFNYQGGSLRIGSPCDLILAQGVTFGTDGDLCLEAGRDIYVRSAAAVDVTGELAAVSSGGTFTLGQGASLGVGSLLLSAPLGVELISDSRTEVDAGAAVDSAGEGGAGRFLLGIAASIEAGSLSVTASGSAWIRRGSVTLVGGTFELNAAVCTLSPLATITAGGLSGACLTPP